MYSYFFIYQIWWPQKGPFRALSVKKKLTSETVQSTALPLESIDHIHSCYGLPLGMLGVGDGITDNVLKEDLEDTAGLFVDETRNTLYATSTSQTTDSWFGDTLDVITQHLPVPLCTSLSQSLPPLPLPVIL